MNPTWTSDCGTVRLWLGDCLDVMATWPDSTEIVSDVPYGLEYDSSASSQRGITPFPMIGGDDKPFDAAPILRFRDALIWSLPQLTLNVPHCGAWYAWDKITRNDYGCRISEYEYCWHRRATKTRGIRHMWSGAYRDSERGEKRKHPNQKPIEVMQWSLQWVTGHIIADPFMGSGTTGVAAVRLGRSFWGVELDPGYFESAKKRIQDELRRVAFLEGNAEPKQQQRELAI